MVVFNYSRTCAFVSFNARKWRNMVYSSSILRENSMLNHVNCFNLINTYLSSNNIIPQECFFFKAILGKYEGRVAITTLLSEYNGDVECRSLLFYIEKITLCCQNVRG